MPKGHLVSFVFGSTPPIRWKYFNFVSVISFRKKLFEEINSVVSELNSLISFISANHAAYGSNCGKGYLPYSQKEHKTSLLISRKPETENEEKILKSIADKVLPKMYLPSRIQSVFNTRFTNPQIVQSLINDTITNILISER